MRLGVNIDHIATIREARKDVYPDIVSAAKLAINSGADGITIHLREDRRHIQDEDVRKLRKMLKGRHLNLEMAAVGSIADIAIKVKPDAVCIVPEKRQEVTTEGGLDVISGFLNIRELTAKIMRKNIHVSLFIDPDIEQINAAKGTGADYIEIHTGKFAEYSDKNRPFFDQNKARSELQKILYSAKYARSLGLRVNAGHGLTYNNVKRISVHTELFEELNIGHNIIARAIFVGLEKAIQEMKQII